MRSFFAALGLAYRALMAQRMRTALTSLGILIGIAAVVIVVALGQGAKAKVSSQLQSLGSNVVYVFARPTAKSGARAEFGRGAGLTLTDAATLRREANALDAVTVYASTRILAQTRWSNDRIDVVGGDEYYVKVRGYQLEGGRDLSREDLQTHAKVLLLGTTVREKLFAGQSPLGQQIRIGRHSYTVVGLLDSKGQSPFGTDQDDRVIVPIGSWFSRISPGSSKTVQIVMGSAKESRLVPRAARQVKAIMRQSHAIQESEEEDFTVRTQQQFQATQDSIAGALSLLLLSVAAIALLVGGVGVMNVMLVSVNERKREIGIRMAIGAQAKDVRLQFMMEAVALTSIGGVAGLVLAAAVITALQQAFDGVLAFDWVSVGAALAVSLGVGIVFGFLPAHRAAALDPIEALRHE